MDTPPSTFFVAGGAGLTSDREDWRTPPDLFRSLDEEFHFTLDAAANEANHLCPRYYSKLDSAFAHAWTGERVFCNPPYGRDSGRWIAKFAHEAGGGGQPSLHFFRRARTRAHSMTTSTGNRASKSASFAGVSASAILTRALP